MRRRGTSCMSPSPLCGEMVGRTTFDRKTHMNLSDLLPKAVPSPDCPRESPEGFLRAPESFLGSSPESFMKSFLESFLESFLDSFLQSLLELAGKLLGELAGELPGELPEELPAEFPRMLPRSFLVNFLESFL